MKGKCCSSSERRNPIPHFRQPILGIISTVLMMVLSIGFISLFDWPVFSGWVAYLLMCTIPATIVIGVIWVPNYPRFAVSRRQPLHGLLLLLAALAVGAVVAVIHFFTVGGGVGSPVPMLVQCIIVSVVVTFWMTIMWGGWPFVLISNRMVAGLSLLAGCYLVNYMLFRVFFDYGFLTGTPVYRAELDPHGRFDAWSATVLYVTCLSVMFLVLHFDLWPITRVRFVMRQPLLGLVWTAIAVVLGVVIFTIGTGLLSLKPPVFLVKVPIPFIFGTVIVLNMLEGSLFARYSQPVKGVCSALTAGVIGTVLALGYGALSSVVTGAVASGPPAYDFEVWVASALLAVTFPFLAYYCDFFQMWPLKADRPVTPPPEGSEV